MESACRLIYDAALEPQPVGLLTTWLVGLAAGIGLCVASIGKKRIIFAGVWTWFWLVAGGLGARHVWTVHSEAASIASARSYDLVVGTVQDFNHVPPNGHGKESFKVGGTHFQYTDGDLSHGGFAKTSRWGGPMREGLFVKIGHRNGIIYHLEICDPAADSVPASSK